MKKSRIAHSEAEISLDLGRKSMKSPKSLQAGTKKEETNRTSTKILKSKSQLGIFVWV